eukprot:12327184-Ditylum_brightwellii.AAC.1
MSLEESNLHATVSDAATLKISNQKNGRIGQTIHYKSFEFPDYPMKALSQHVHSILWQGSNGASLLSEVPSNGTIYHVTPADMIALLCQVVCNLKLNESAINPDLTRAHSLFTGGDMAFKLNRVSNTTIMKLGPWSSLTFLVYIHNQIGHLSKDLSS